MKKLLAGLVAAATVALAAPRADAKVAAVYASGQVGAQTRGNHGVQLGFEAGAHVLIFDGYVSYLAFGAGQSVSRAILGLRGGFGVGPVRLVLRGGLGAIRESSGALTGPAGTIDISRTGGVARGGASLEGRLYHGVWLGLGADAEEFLFSSNGPGLDTHGGNIVGLFKLTIELGI
jgi:hypothetical protein